MKILATLSLTGICLSAAGQGTFQNLDFERANLDPSSSAVNVPLAIALPGWSVYYGAAQQTAIDYNDISEGSTRVTLVSSASQTFPAIDGDFSVLLQGGVTAAAASISQIGVIPSDAQSLLFKAQLGPQLGPGKLIVSVGGQNVLFDALGTSADFTLYGASVSAWAGSSEQLTFSALDGYGANNWLVDDITFSTQAVPEPSPLILAGFGGLMFLLRRRFAANKR